jgi:hypothetical protein
LLLFLLRREPSSTHKATPTEVSPFWDEEEIEQRDQERMAAERDTAA